MVRYAYSQVVWSCPRRKPMFDRLRIPPCALQGCCTYRRHSNKVTMSRDDAHYPVRVHYGSPSGLINGSTVYGPLAYGSAVPSAGFLQGRYLSLSRGSIREVAVQCHMRLEGVTLPIAQGERVHLHSSQGRKIYRRADRNRASRDACFTSYAPTHVHFFHVYLYHTYGP